MTVESSCKSMESVYSHSAASSSKQSGCSLNMYKRKPQRAAGGVAPVSEVRQRVVSARMHRIRNIQNQLSDAQLHISVRKSNRKHNILYYNYISFKCVGTN